jgi:hypothetical protein
MITFQEMQSALERLAELLKAASSAESTIKGSVGSLGDVRQMLEARRLRQFKDVEAVVDYVEKVVIPQLNGIHDTLGVSGDAHFSRVRTASEQASRLSVRVQALNDASAGGLLG